jgi:hypothetical protein
MRGINRKRGIKLYLEEEKEQKKWRKMIKG